MARFRYSAHAVFDADTVFLSAPPGVSSRPCCINATIDAIRATGNDLANCDESGATARLFEDVIAFLLHEQ